MSAFQLCPTCFAEVYDQEVCDFCGSTLEREQVASSDKSDAQGLYDSQDFQAIFELAGLPIQVRDWRQIPKSTLFRSRYSLLQWKQQLESGHCYIAYDHALGQHAFVTLFPSPSPLSQYHQHICFLSTVYDAGLEPSFSVFLPQEGLPIEQALQRLGWSTGRIWELFRQVCQLAITVETRNLEAKLPLYPPSHIWVRPDGQVEMSVQLQDEVDLATPLIHQLVHLLGWLYDPSQSAQLTMFPLRLRPVILSHWERMVSVEEFWKDINATIQNKGWYCIAKSDSDWLMRNHAPDTILLFDEQIKVPSTIQLCVWNAVVGSAVLDAGQVVLASCLEALLEVGVVDVNEGGERLLWMEQLVMGVDTDIRLDTLADVLLTLRYGDRSSAQRALSDHIRMTKHLSDWLQIAQTLFAIGDIAGAKSIVDIALRRVDYLQEGIEIATTVRWWGGDITWSKRILKRLWAGVEGLWNMTDWIEAWVALIHQNPDAKILTQIQLEYGKASDTERREWWQHIDRKFGPLQRTLFAWR